MPRPIVVEIVELLPGSTRIRSSRRITPGLDVLVRLTTADATVTVVGAVSRCHVVPLPRGHVAYDATVTFSYPPIVSVLPHGAAHAAPGRDLVILTGAAPQSTDDLITLFDGRAI